MYLKVVISCDKYPAIPSAKEGFPKKNKGTKDNLLTTRTAQGKVILDPIPKKTIPAKRD